MDKLIEHIIVRIIKEQGFEYAETQAIKIFRNALELYLSAILRTLLAHNLHSGKYNTNIMSLLNIINYENLTYEHNLEPLPYSEPEFEKVLEFKSSLSTYMERYIHIHDFMPPFPAIHTFRQTFSKNKEKTSTAELVKTRLEQSLKAEENLLKLVKASDSMPTFINYLYKK